MEDRAVHAAIVNLVDLLFRLNYQAVVYAYLAELILDDGYALAVLGGKDVVHYGRTSGRRRRSQDRNLALEEFGDASVISPSVVFPAPRKPVMIVTGTLSSSVMNWWGARYPVRAVRDRDLIYPMYFRLRQP